VVSRSEEPKEGEKIKESKEIEMKRYGRYEITELLKMGLTAFLFFMLVVGIWSLYSSLNQVISLWFNYKYAAIYRVILNVGVVVVVFFVLTRLIESYRQR
jgi:hypothetical protein